MSALLKSRRGRRAFTLVELLIAMAITVVIVYAMAQVFAMIGDNVKDARAVLEMNGQLRTAALRLELDLDGLTVPVRPWPKASSALGYFEYHEGPGRDFNPFPDGANFLNQSAPGDPFIIPGTGPVSKAPLVMANTTLGDLDDVLAFTARAAGEPFRGQIAYGLRAPNLANPNEADGRLVVDPSIAGPIVLESSLAEIIWWTTLEDLNDNGVFEEGEHVTLHRRALLIRPDLNTYLINVDPDNNSVPDLGAFYQENDLSVRLVSTSRAASNSLADLTKRENRVARLAAFPFPFGFDPTATSGSVPGLVLQDLRQGDDVILSHVVAFDIKAFDPLAPLFQDPSQSRALTPSDPEWYDQLASGTVVGRGAFVDLNFANNAAVSQNSGFSGAPEPRSQLGVATYCTWSFHYEHDNVNQDSALGNDQGVNGYDDDNANGVDDIGERETSPPYPIPLRGIRVSMRLIEIDSQQVRQTSVSTDLIPE